MPKGAEPALYIILADEVTRGQIPVSLEAYAQFCLEMEQALEKLVATAPSRRTDAGRLWPIMRRRSTQAP